MERAAFRKNQRRLNVWRLVFVDEFGINRAMSRIYARAPRGERARVKEPTERGANISVISALRLSGVGATMMIEGAVDTQVWDLYIERFLVPELKPGDIVMLDQISFHGSLRAIGLIFGEELALINYCNKPGPRGNAHLRAVLIVAADTGLRENEMFTLEKSDIDFGSGVINVRAINAKTNRPRTIPMTGRVKEELARLNETVNGNLIFGGLKEVKRSFATARRANKITNLRKHDFRHAFVSRSILAGIPPAVALKASGHASDEWKRYLNMTPDQLQKLFNPLEGQVVEDVKRYGLDILQQLREALGYTDIANLIASLESRH